MNKWLLVLVGVGLLVAGWLWGRQTDQGPWTQYAACPVPGEVRNAQGVCENPFASMTPVCPAGYTLNPSNSAECLSHCGYGYMPDPAKPDDCTIAPGFVPDTSQIDANNTAAARSMERYQDRAAADERALQQRQATEAQTRALERVDQDLKR